MSEQSSSLAAPLLDKQSVPSPRSPLSPRTSLADLREWQKERISLGAGVNLVNAIIGAGILTLPLVTSRCGIALGLSLMCCFAFQTVYVTNILRECCDFTGATTYAQMARELFGKKVETFINFVMTVYPSGVACSYLLVLGNEIKIVFSLLQQNQMIQLPYPWMESRGFLLSVFTWLVIFPLALLKNMKALQFTSFLSLLCALYITSVVALQAPFNHVCELAENASYTCENGKCVVASQDWLASYGSLTSCEMACEGASTLEPESIVWFSFGTGLWQSLPLLTFTFNCCVQFIPVFTEMKRAQGIRVRVTVASAVLFCLTAYFICALGGYLSFCDRSCPNILDCYPANNRPILLARIGIVFILLFSFPLASFAVRLGFDRMFGLTTVTHFLVTAAVVAFANVVAIEFDNLALVLGLNGAIGGSIIVQIFPGLCAWEMSRQGNYDKLASMTDRRRRGSGMAIFMSPRPETERKSRARMLTALPDQPDAKTPDAKTQSGRAGGRSRKIGGTVLICAGCTMMIFSTYMIISAA